MMKNYFMRVQEQTPTRFWINNVTREQAKLAIDAGACGCTQNPAYTWKMLNDSTEKEYAIGILREIMRDEPDDDEALVKLQRALVERIAEAFLPMYESSGGKLGYVSIQGNPFKEDTESILRYARFNTEKYPNIMAKIPATVDGLKAIEILVGERVPINATEVMAVRQALDVCEAYKKGSQGIETPAQIYFSHIAGIYDEHLKNVVRKQEIDVTPDVLWQAGVSIGKKAYHMARSICPEMGFISGGARGLHHFTEMVGASAVVTINWKGTADLLIEQDPVVVENFLRPTPDYVVDELVEKLDDYRRGYFVNAIQPEEYEEFGPVVLFRNSFEDAWSNALKLIADLRGN